MKRHVALCATESKRCYLAGALGIQTQETVTAGCKQRPEDGERLARWIGCLESQSPETDGEGGPLSGVIPLQVHSGGDLCAGGCFSEKTITRPVWGQLLA